MRRILAEQVSGERDSERVTVKPARRAARFEFRLEREANVFDLGMD